MLPGSGGEITNIVYDGMTIHSPIWWNIYIGPQQQKQPGGDGPGCMFYPLGGCETQPLISMNNIILRNVVSHGGPLTPGVIRCNDTNPCTGFEFTNVHIHGWWRLFGMGYITENTSGTVTNSRPVPAFSNLDESDFEQYDLYEILAQEFEFYASTFIIHPAIKASLDGLLDYIFEGIYSAANYSLLDDPNAPKEEIVEDEYELKLPLWSVLEDILMDLETL